MSGLFYRRFIRPLLFSLDAEKAHDLACSLLKFTSSVPLLKTLISTPFTFAHPSLRTSALGLEFPNPVGLAAGFDKNCELYSVLPCFGFGFLECGTVTPRPQEGNPKPRIFRLPEDHALINRLGFNNKGVEKAATCLSANTSSRAIPLGINIGKNAETPLEKAAEDYLAAFEKLYPYADYIAINVSSPNTPRLRELQGNLAPLLSTLQEKNRALAQKFQKLPKPLLLKISPDLEHSQAEKVLDACLSQKVSGLIATNTTISRKGLTTPTSMEGGLSGKLLFDPSTEMIRFLYKRAGKQIVLIGTGGIFTAEDAYRKIKVGASLVQLYTGWVYGGPATVSRINSGLVHLMEKDGVKNIQQAVGSET